MSRVKPMPDEAQADPLWVRFSTGLSDIWLRHGFRPIPTSSGVGVLRDLAETTQLVAYDVGDLTPEHVTVSIELGVWSHRLLKMRTSTGGDWHVRDAHWWNVLADLMPGETGHLWWTVMIANFEVGISSHAELAETTILPILGNLDTDAALVKAWRSGGRMAGLDRRGDRGTNAVRLAEMAGGPKLAQAVAHDMEVVAERARRNRPVAVAKIRQLLESLPFDAEFIEASPDDEATNKT